mmetsp:Transcript_8651/g.24318  ORF Transcript_8651/g.24318 Transcript_8651/m.24318 type:complete len:913 (+) Transcript_8651:63-2801(+)
MVSGTADGTADAQEVDWDPFADPADTEPLKPDTSTALQDVITKVLAVDKPLWDPFADPTAESEERERQERIEEAKEKAEMEAFRWEVELEAEIMARARAEEGDQAACRGVAMQVKFPSQKAPEEKVDMFFGDAFNKCFISAEAAVRQDASAFQMVMIWMDQRWHPVCALMQGLMHMLFRPDAWIHFQAFIDIFTVPSVGLLETLSQCFNEDSSSPSNRLGELFCILSELLKELLRIMKRMTEMLAMPSHDVARENFRHLWTLSQMLELSPLEALLPDVADEDAMNITLRPADHSAHDTFGMRVHKEMTAAEFKDLMICRLHQPRDIQLYQEVGNGDLQPLTTLGKLRASSGNLVVQGLAAVEGGDALERRVQKPLYKITTRTGTRLLVELRTKYQEPDFYREYHDLRRAVKPGGEALHIRKALTVQSVVLPKFAFDGTLRGVMEMRNQVSALADSDPPLFKALKDIHKLLDAHQDLPKMPIVKVIEAPRFEVDDTNGWIEHLVNEGFVVIKSVADESMVKTAYDLLWEFLEEADAGSAVRRNKVDTWWSGRDGHGWAGAADDGIIQGRGIGQSEVLWSLRGLPTVRKVFADLWGTEQLVSSFDGAGVFRPYGIHREYKTTKKNWYHLDQAHYKRGLHCVQGLVTLKDATEETGGLVVVPRSHRFHNDICCRYKAGDMTSDFLSINVNDRVLTEGNLGPRMVAAKAGDMILWDSRTIHCNTSPLKESWDLLQGNDLVRAVCYICMTPAAWCTDDIFKRRQQAFENGVTTAHWPHEYHPKNTPRARPPSIPLTQEQKNLICPFDKVAVRNLQEAGVKPGAISFLPPRQFKVAHDSIPLRRSPTTEWGSTIGGLKCGEVVKGYVMGEWLRLIHWTPGAGKPPQARQPEDEVWAFLGDASAGSPAFELCTSNGASS